MSASRIADGSVLRTGLSHVALSLATFGTLGVGAFGAVAHPNHALRPLGRLERRQRQLQRLGRSVLPGAAGRRLVA